VEYEGDMLLQNLHDDVEITLLTETIQDTKLQRSTVCHFSFPNYSKLLRQLSPRIVRHESNTMNQQSVTNALHVTRQSIRLKEQLLVVGFGWLA